MGGNNWLFKKSKRSQKNRSGKNKARKRTKRKTEIGKDWTRISLGFDELYKKRWVESGFNYYQTKEWIDIGFKPGGDNAYFCAWIRDIKGKDAEWFLNFGNEKELRKEYNSILTSWE